MNDFQKSTSSMNALRMAARYKSARLELLIVIAFTVLNIVMYFLETSTVMLFSAMIPFLAVFYGNGFEIDPEIGFSLGTELGLAIAAICLATYLLCWLLSKKNHVWLIVAAVLYGLDSVIMVYFYYEMEILSDSIIDIVIHCLVMYYFIAGAIVGKDLKKLESQAQIPQEAVEFSIEQDEPSQENIAPQEPEKDSAPLRLADADAKARIFLEADYSGLNIVYRRVKRTNELVINGRVYDEVEMLVETAHILKANVNGTNIQAGINDASRMFIAVNGEVIAKKIRLV